MSERANATINGEPHAFDGAVAKAINERDEEIARLRRALDSIKVRSRELGRSELHGMALSALQEKE
tara:strand:- start:337 stop:534 length:198 start_codon:yes stop_codon:yes gene_type:complete